jgi:hypothetical protein
VKHKYDYFCNNLNDLESKRNPTTMAQVEDKPTVLAKVGVIKEFK